MNRAIFLDRDGVINKTIFRMGKERAPYSLEEFKFIDGVTDVVKDFKESGFLVIVVTNQPDVARGWVSREVVELLNNYVKTNLSVDEIKVCFHTEKENCSCRKPKPGMITEAAKSWKIDLSKSFMVGDRMSDIEAGQAAGCKSILVGNNNDHANSSARPDYVCENLAQASQWIFKSLA